MQKAADLTFASSSPPMLFFLAALLQKFASAAFSLPDFLLQHYFVGVIVFNNLYFDCVI